MGKQTHQSTILETLAIENFVTIERAEISFAKGFNAITGETGAGKSLMLQAIKFGLGAKAHVSLIRKDTTKAEVTLVFRIHEEMQKKLDLFDLIEDGNIIVRRILTHDGRTKAYLNGRIVSAQELKYFGLKVASIQSQHDFFALMEPQAHLEITDLFAQLLPLREQVKEAYHAWQHKKKQQTELEKTLEVARIQHELISYQLEEFNHIAPEENEWQTRQEALHYHAQASHIVERLDDSLRLLNADGNQAILSNLRRLEMTLSKISAPVQHLKESIELLQQAEILLTESVDSLTQAKDSVDKDESTLLALEKRLDQLQTLARKHKINPVHLFEHYEALSQKHIHFEENEIQRQTLSRETEQAFDVYSQRAYTLHEKRKAAAEHFAQELLSRLSALDLPACAIQLLVTERSAEHGNETGLSDVVLLATTNPGHPLKPIQDIASGGELSRIHLALKLLLADKQALPILIFDELEVGIGGETLNHVSDNLKMLSHNAQIICITHAASLAARAEQHCKIVKRLEDHHSFSEIHILNTKERVAEIARLLSGGEEAIAHEHAKQLLSIA